MNAPMMQWLLMLCIVLVIFVMPSRANGPYEISWYTIDGGGGTSAGGQYILTGTIGQPDTHHIASSPPDRLRKLRRLLADI